MNVLLCGYHWIGCRVLDKLLQAGHNIFVYTHVSPWYIPSLKNYAAKRGVKYSLNRISLNNFPFDPDVIVSIYYKYIIKPPVIEAVDGKIFNLHPSLLPKYKGCSSVTWALINGEKEYGYTYHYIDKGIDTGNILLQKRLPIYDFDTQISLYQKVMFEAEKDFDQVLQKVIDGDKGQVQKGEGVYYHRGCPYGGEIDDRWDDDQIERFIRAMIYPPMKPAVYKGKEVRSLEEYKKLRNGR